MRTRWGFPSVNEESVQPILWSNRPQVTRQQPPDLVFVSEPDADFEIYVMDGDGSDVTRLTNHPADDTFATWSPTP